MHIAFSHDRLGLTQTQHDRDHGDDQQHDHNGREDIVHPILKGFAEPERRDLKRLVREFLDRVGQHETDEESRARPVKAAQEDTDQADHEKREDVFEVLSRLERREGDQHEEERREVSEADRGQLGDSARGRDAQQRADDIGQRQQPDNRIGDVEVVAQHRGADFDLAGPQQGDGTDEDRHGARTGNAEQQGRDQAAALFRIVRAFRPDHATHFAFAEVRFVLRRLNRVPIGDPVND